MNKKGSVGSLLLLFIGVIVALAILVAIAGQTSSMLNRATVTETIDIAAARGNFSDPGETFNEVNTSYYFHLTYGCPMATTTWRSRYEGQCDITVISVTNSSDTLVDPDDYVAISNGAVCTGSDSGDIHFVNSASIIGMDTNDTIVTYSYCPDGYLTDGGERSIAGLILVFTTLGMLGFVIYYLGKGWFK